MKNRFFNSAPWFFYRFTTIKIFIQFNYVFIIYEWKSIFISSKKNNFLEFLTIITILIIDNLYETLSLTEILQIFSLVSRRKLFAHYTRFARYFERKREKDVELIQPPWQKETEPAPFEVSSNTFFFPPGNTTAQGWIVVS